MDTRFSGLLYNDLLPSEAAMAGRAAGLALTLPRLPVEVI